MQGCAGSWLDAGPFAVRFIVYCVGERAMTVTIIELFALIAKVVRRFVIRHELANISYHRTMIQSRRDNDFYVERILDKREAVLRSELNCL
jgi:hypothetical protein